MLATVEVKGSRLLKGGVSAPRQRKCAYRIPSFLPTGRIEGANHETWFYLNMSIP
jgi:hypothetical protein